MKPAKGIAMAVAVGYLIASQRKLRTALVLGGAAAQEELAKGAGGQASGGAFRQLGHASIAAARTALSKPAERLANRLNEASGALREGGQAGLGQGKRNQPEPNQPGPNRPNPNRPEEADVGAGPDEGHVRTGKYRSRTLKYSQEITSPDEDAQRPGRSLVTTHHTVIKQWAEERGAEPATVAGTEHADHLGVLRFDFGGHNENLRHVSWQEWFDTFDSRRLNFIYQEERTDGRRSNFFRLENPDREH